MMVIGLTGSVGMGKSTTAGLFASLGVPSHDADLAVHALYAGEAAPLIEAAFPGTLDDRGHVDRAALGRAVLGDAPALARLEAIVHPLVRRAEQQFLERSRAGGHRFVVLDVPLLLETNGIGRCDAVVVVSAPEAVQRARVLARPGMTEERLEGILRRQMPDAEKRRHAHWVIDTGRGIEPARRAVEALIRAWSGPAAGLGRSLWQAAG